MHKIMSIQKCAGLATKWNMEYYQCSDFWHERENSKMHTASPTDLHTQSPSPPLHPQDHSAMTPNSAYLGSSHTRPLAASLPPKPAPPPGNPPTNLSSAPFSHCSNTLSMRPAHTLDLNRNLPLHGTIVPSVPPLLLSECYWSLPNRLHSLLIMVTVYLPPQDRNPIKAGNFAKFLLLYLQCRNHAWHTLGRLVVIPKATEAANGWLNKLILRCLLVPRYPSSGQN